MELNRFKQLLESTMGNVKPLLNEFDYEEHKHPNINIIDRVVVTFNPSSQDVIEVEGLLGESKNQEMIYFKPLTEPKIFESSDPLNLEIDNEISLYESHTHTQRAVETLVNNIGNWMGISFQGERFNLDIDFGRVINTNNTNDYGMNYIGNWNCIFKSIKFDKV